MIICGDALAELRKLPDGSVQTCITSPPYYGLRDYGTARWEGGEFACDHHQKSRFDYKLKTGLGPTGAQTQGSNRGSGDSAFRDLCGKCGARRIDAQLGLEKTPQEYIAKMVEVFREVRRVLRKDGTLWLNLGDSYANQRWGDGNSPPPTNTGNKKAISHTRLPDGLKPKDLIGIPWRVAFALQEDGWYLRQDIIWHKPNPMPESVTDRCTKAHEYIFLMAKSSRYYFDQEATAEPAKGENAHDLTGQGYCAPGQSPHTGSRIKKPAGWKGGPGNHRSLLGRHPDVPAWKEPFRAIAATRNRRDVWTVATEPYEGTHFATFPKALVEPMILAGCPKGGTVLDPFCGAVTVGLVALHHGREFIGIDLNPDYCEMGRKRINGNLFPERET